MKPWRLSNRFDPEAVALADRHYSRQKPGTDQFVAPGRCIVLLAGIPALALWVSSWPLPEYTHHAWAEAWACSLFRNEGAGLSSALILAAVACTVGVWGPPPNLGMVTFIARESVRPKRDPGRCFLMAGFDVVGETKKRKRLVLRLPAERMPEARLPTGYQLDWLHTPARGKGRQ